MFTKQKIAMVVAEFLGTFVLTYTILAVALSNVGVGYFIAFGAGLALGLLVLLLGGISGAVLNPAVTIGLWSVRKLQTYQAIIYLAAQFAGGILAYVLFKYISGNDLSNREFAKYDTQILIAEVLGAAVLAMGYAAATYNNLLNSSKAFVIGAALTIGMIAAASHEGAGFINPAVALGSHVLDVSDWGSLGNFVLGPILGAVLGLNLYSLLFAPTALVPAATNLTVAEAATTRTAKQSRASKPVSKKPARKVVKTKK